MRHPGVQVQRLPGGEPDVLEQQRGEQPGVAGVCPAASTLNRRGSAGPNRRTVSGPSKPSGSAAISPSSGRPFSRDGAERL
ncbi:hypothetical protein [Kitasatospora sp. NPDC056531]|uniref:hypothetical protein n=1 Tax=Kitasatospora sp. NPDC056531 TaxID=3345856 RepID=UPI0036832E9C